MWAEFHYDLDGILSLIAQLERSQLSTKNISRERLNKMPPRKCQDHVQIKRKTAWSFVISGEIKFMQLIVLLLKLKDEKQHIYS
jgi:hypothetical protein